MVITAVLLLMVVLVLLVAAALWQVIRLNQSQGAVWDVLRRAEAQRDEEARSAALLAARLETNLGQTEASVKVLEYGLRNGQARTLEAFAALAAQFQTDGQVLKESMQAIERRWSEAQTRLHDAVRQRLDAQEAQSQAREDSWAQTWAALSGLIRSSAEETKQLVGSLELRWSEAETHLRDELLQGLGQETQSKAREDSWAQNWAALSDLIRGDAEETRQLLGSLEQRLSEAQAQMHDAGLKRLTAQEAESKVRDDELGRKVAASLDQIKISAQATEKSVRSLESRLSKVQSRMREALLERLEAHQAAAKAGEDERARSVAALADQVKALEGRLAADGKEKKPAAPDFGFQQRTESENLVVAKSLAFLRPLVPHPGWRFDIEWDNPDLAFQMRRQLWCYFNERRLHLPLVMQWYDDLHINVYLGNDMSKQLFIGGCYEPNEFAFLNTVLAPGMTVVDAGANAGLYTLFASRRVGPSGEVWAFEPSERDFTRLQQNLELNQLTNVEVFRIALSSCDGEAELAVAGCEHEGQNTLGSFAYDAATLLRKERVSLRKLDDLAAEQHLSGVDLIKADVEGAELRVFEGARAILQEMRPIVLFELSEKALNNQGASSEDLLALLRSFDYRIYTFDEETGQPVPANGRALSDNLVAAPSEKPLPATSTVV